LHRPAVLFLDEPTLGLDPQTRARTWEYIRKMAQKERTTVVLTTHYMEEAQLMCDRIGIIDAGQIIALDTPGNMIDRMGGDIIAINSPNPPLNKIRSLPYVSAIKTVGETIEISMKSAHLHLAELLSLIDNVVSVEIRKPTLNDVFIKLTGRDIRQEDVENGGGWVETIARYRQRGK
jgi:ABC-2 type transport system ATP-binding protein